MIEGVDAAQMSRTFQDAVFITRALGYRYIWIDSLCIIQDSEADWKIEANLMAKVYGSAACTVAAIGSDGDSGCFRRRNPLLRRPGKLIESSGVPVYGYNLPYDAADYPILEDSEGVPGLVNLPLLRRAWVVQERLISNRMLYYGHHGLMWECAMSAASEFRPQIFPVPVLKDAEKPIKFALRRIMKENVLSDLSRRQSFLETWFRVVDIYTGAAITYPTDRIAALAGIAELIRSSTGLDYIAGLWPAFMPEVLLWTPAVPLQETPSPSWSWLRLNLSIIHPPVSLPKNLRERATLYLGRGEVESTTVPDNNILGELIRGKLRVTGVIRKMYFPVDDETGLTTVGTMVFVRPTRLYKKQFLPAGWYKYYPDVNPREGFDVHFLMLKRMKYQIEQRPARGPDKTFATEFEEQGLVMIPYANEKGGWIKIGSFSIIHKVDWPADVETLPFPGFHEGEKEEECVISLY